MDDFAWEVGSFLAGNREPVISLEYFHPGPVVRFTSPALISISGPGCTGKLDGKPIPGWHPVLVGEGAVLELPSSASGRCGYLSIHGGLHASEYLGSASTSLTSGAGGFRGLRLETGDAVDFISALNIREPGAVLGWTITARDQMLVYGQEKHISLLPGPETFLLDELTRQDLSLLSFTVDPSGNRMGYRLKGNRVSVAQQMELVSSPVDLGVVQLLPDGQLIVLMADHQTTGGYPRIGCVVRTDLPRLVQSVPGRNLFFSWCSAETADRLRNERTHRLEAIRTTCLLNINSYL